MASCHYASLALFVLSGQVRVILLKHSHVLSVSLESPSICLLAVVLS